MPASEFCLRLTLSHTINLKSYLCGNKDVLMLTNFKPLALSHIYITLQNILLVMRYLFIRKLSPHLIKILLLIFLFFYCGYVSFLEKWSVFTLFP